MRQLQHVLATGTAVLLASACAARPTTVARANSDDTAQPACNGEALLVLQSHLMMNIEIVERRSRDGVAVTVASLSPGAHTTVRLPQASETWYEARVVGTSQPLSAAQYGRRSHSRLIGMDIQCR